MEFRRTSFDSLPPPTNTSSQQPEPASSSSDSPPSGPHPHALPHNQRPPSWFPHLSSIHSTKVQTATEIAKAAIQAELQNLSAKSAFYARHLVTGETIEIDADKTMNSLSLIKLAVVMQAYKEVEEGRLDLNKPHIIMEDDLCAGTGQFTRDHVGTSKRLIELIELALRLSDNGANDKILALFGISKVNEFLANCKYNAALMSESREVFRALWAAKDPRNALLSNGAIFNLGIPSPGEMDDLTAKWESDPTHWVGKITARAAGQMFEDIYHGKHLSEEHCKQILNFMYNQHYDSRLPQGLGDIKIAHKTGDFPPYAGHDAGLINAETGPIVAVVLTGQNTGDFAKLEAAQGRIAELLIENWG